ncbi:MAG TPA: ADP-ribosylation factor-like protein [Thermoanaerobaculia bacterium]
MVLFNHATREMTAKIVYYGPGLCGKTTNLMVIFDKLSPEQKGKMLSLATKTDRTLFFDLLPVDIGKVGPFNLKIQLYTVPGQVFYNETRKLVLRGADSVVFVADSQPAMVDANKESFANLIENLEENNIDVNDTPIVIQYNKRDIPGVLPVEALAEALGFEGYPYTEAAAVKGEGVMETFKLVSKITAKHLFNRLKGGNTVAPKKKVAAPAMATAAKVAVRPAPEPEPDVEPEPIAETNPFADSLPFPDSAAEPEAVYEAAEEVSLEQLLAEGRERPRTFGGNVPLPHAEEVEELGADEMLPIVDEAPLEVAVEEELPAPIPFADRRKSDLEEQVQSLQQQLEDVKEQHRTELQTLLRELDALAARVRAQLS